MIVAWREGARIKVFQEKPAKEGTISHLANTGFILLGKLGSYL